MVWGTMMPTNPMRPLTATAAAVARVAAATTTSRTLASRTPRLEASSSRAAHDPDEAAPRARGRGGQGGGGHHHQPDPGRADPEAGGLVVAHGEHVQQPPVEQDGGRAEARGRPHQGHPP